MMVKVFYWAKGRRTSPKLLVLFCTVSIVLAVNSTPTTALQGVPPVAIIEPNYGTKLVEIVDDLIPPIIDPPEDVEYEDGSTGNTITWIASDDHPDTYSVFLDGVLYESGIWESGVPISIPIDGLAIGTYEFEIIINDGFDNSVMDTVFVTVHEDDDDTPPTIEIYYEGGHSTSNPGEWIVLIEDLESGIDEVLIEIDGSLYFHDQNLNGIQSKIYDVPVPGSEATHTINITAINNDKNYVGDQESSTASSQVQIVYIPPILLPQEPVADAGPDLTCYVGEMVSFDGTLTSDRDTPNEYITYLWDFGDGATVSGMVLEQPTHTYTSPGTYVVTLTVIDDFKLSDTDTTTVTVLPPVEGPLFSNVFWILPIAVLFGALVVLRRKRNQHSAN